MSGIELMALRMARRIREHNEEVDRINAMNNQQITSTNTSNRITTPEPQPEPEISRYAAWSFRLMLWSLVWAVLGPVSLLLSFTFTAVLLLSLSGACGLAAITLAVLSLRENL